MGKKLIAKNKRVHKIGINDAEYVVRPTIKGKQIWCPYYRKWQNMLYRCTEKCWKDNPTYLGCKVCDEWISFMAFRSWLEKQLKILGINKKDLHEYELDKDIFGDGQLFYSPKTCCMIPKWLNQSFKKRETKYAPGVSKRGKGFQVYWMMYGEPEYLGTYDTVAEAHEAYCEAKREYVIKRMKEEGITNKRIVDAVTRKLELEYSGVLI